MTKAGFSFGLKKSGPASKPAPDRRKPATFGGGDDDSDNDVPFAGVAATSITELSFDSLETVTGDTKPKPKLPRGAPIPLSLPEGLKTKAKAAPPSQFDDLSSVLASKKHASAAAAADPSIYDYDGVYDSLKAAAHKNKQHEDSDFQDKRPRYFDALQKAADVRERDRQIAEEKRLRREREAEGDEFADKEKFVTEAYKRQQEENRRLEDEEKRREEAETKKNKNKGMVDFYKQMLQRGEEEHQAVVKAVEEGLGKNALASGERDHEKTAEERAKEINALGGNITINDDGEVVDKRQLLKGGLNVAPKKKAEAQQEKAKQAARGPSTTGIPSRGVFNGGGKNAMRERQTQMLEAQLAETLKRSREEEEAEKAKIELVVKSRKTEAEISSAKERYLARKRAAEEAKKNSTAEL